MDEIELFDILEEKKKSDLLELLQSAYSEMTSKQRSYIFGDIMLQEIKAKKIIDEDELLDEVKTFYKKSLAGYYYAPFAINSKNFMDIPEETDEWCNKTTLLLEESTQLTDLGKHTAAIKCFQMLFELMDRLGDDEIIFAEEVGTWMIGADEDRAIKAYITSLKQIATPKDFSEHLSPLLIRDSHESFSKEVYTKVKKLANKEQKCELDRIIKERGIRVKV
jgi:hypothetical protein